MSSTPVVVPEVFTIREIARAAGVSTADVRAVLDESDVPRIDGFVALPDAARAVSLLRSPVRRTAARRLFAPAPGGTRPALPAAASGVLHAGLLGVMVLIGTLGVRTAPTESKAPDDQVRLVFLATPGPARAAVVAEAACGIRSRRPGPSSQERAYSPVRWW